MNRTCMVCAQSDPPLIKIGQALSHYAALPESVIEEALCDSEEPSTHDGDQESEAPSSAKTRPRNNNRKIFTLDDDSVARLEQICVARSECSAVVKKSYTVNRSQVVRDAIKLLYRYEVDKDSIIHEEDLRFM